MSRSNNLPAADIGEVAESTPAVRRRLKPIALALFLTFFAWQLTTKTLVAYLATRSPELALRLNPHDSEALLNVAERALAAHIKSGDASPQDDARANSSVGAFANPALRRVLELRLKEEGILAGGPGSMKPAGQTKANDGSATNNNAGAAGKDAGLIPLAQIRDWATDALAHDPASSRAVRILGQIADLSGDEERATVLMREAAHRSLHETASVYFMMVRSQAKKDYAATLDYADALMRTRPSLDDLAIPFLTQIAENKEASPLLVERLAAMPPWRPQFIFGMSKSITDARTPLTILLALKNTKAPPTSAEIAGYLKFLIGRNFAELAYYTWLQFLPPSELATARIVFNGSFQSPPSGVPFDWTIMQGTNVVIEMASTPDDENERGLRIDFGTGRVQMGAVTQDVMIPPGDYTLRFKYRGEVIARRGLKWVLSCVGGDSRHIVETPMFIGQQRSWRTLSTDFSIPQDGCKMQQLRLIHDSRSASEEFISGTIWYDEVEIVRADRHSEVKDQ